MQGQECLIEGRNKAHSEQGQRPRPWCSVTPCLPYCQSCALVRPSVPASALLSSQFKVLRRYSLIGQILKLFDRIKNHWQSEMELDKFRCCSHFNSGEKSEFKVHMGHSFECHLFGFLGNGPILIISFCLCYLFLLLLSCLCFISTLILQKNEFSFDNFIVYFDSTFKL